MHEPAPPTPFEIVRQLPGAGSVTLAGESDGDGPPLVLLHGLSATRRNVVQGSRLLARRGWRLVLYDARGHGRSSPAPARGAYGYGDLVGDLGLLLERHAIERPVLVGSSMGAATAIAWALRHAVAALVLITPASMGGPRGGEATWDRLADALERDGVEGFVRLATPPGSLPERWRAPVEAAIRQRMERHEHLGAVADALRVVPRSTAFPGPDALAGIAAPTLVVGSRDEPDPVHPLAVARQHAERLPDAELVVEDEGDTPLAWQGARLSRRIDRFLRERLPHE